MASIPVFSIRPKAQLGQSMQPFENIIQQEKPIRFLLSSLQVSWHKTKQCSVFLIAVCTPKSFVSVCGDGMPRTVYLTECNRLLLVLLTLCVCLSVCVCAEEMVVWWDNTRRCKRSWKSLLPSGSLAMTVELRSTTPLAFSSPLATSYPNISDMADKINEREKESERKSSLASRQIIWI